MPKHDIPSVAVSKYRTYSDAELLKLLSAARSSSEILNEVCQRLEKVRNHNDEVCGDYDVECPVCAVQISCIVETSGVTLREI